MSLSMQFVWRLAALIAALLCNGLAQAAAPGPQRNLNVEMRITGETAAAQRETRAGAAVTIGSSGGIDAAGGATVRSASRQQDTGALQRVLVLNGGQATLRLSRGLLVDDTEVAWTPWGAGAAVRSQWVEVVDGMQVRPRWPGGEAPVTLEITAQSAGGAGLRGGAADRQQPLPPQLAVFTTVQVPLGEWVQVAQLQQCQAASIGSGFGAATASRQRSLQVRVSLP